MQDNSIGLGGENVPIAVYVVFVPRAEWSGEAAQNSEYSETRRVFVLYSLILHLFIQLSFPECLLYATLSDSVDIIGNKAM